MKVKDGASPVVVLATPEPLDRRPPVEVLPEQTGPVFDPATGEVIARVPRGGAAEVDRAVAARRGAFPAWRDTPLIARSQIFFAFRELVYRHREEMAALITRDHGKTFPDALGEVLRGLETVEFACGLPGHLAGMNTPNVSTSDRRAHAAPTARRHGGDHALQLPGDGPDVDLPDRAHVRQHVRLEAVVSHTPGATQLQAELWKEAGLPDGVFNIVYGGREAVTAHRRAPRHRGDPVRGLDRGRALRVRDGHPARQARRLVHERQERDGRAARRGHGADRGRRGRLGLRLGRRALHGADAGDRRRRHRRTGSGRSCSERIAKLKVGPGMEPGMDMGPIYSAEHRAVDHRAGSTRASRRAPSSSSTGARSSTPTNPDGFFLGVDALRPGHAGDGDLPGGDLRARPGDRAGRRRTTRHSLSSTATSTPTARRSSRPTAARPGASSSRWTCR